MQVYLTLNLVTMSTRGIIHTTRIAHIIHIIHIIRTIRTIPDIKCCEFFLKVGNKFLNLDLLAS